MNRIRLRWCRPFYNLSFEYKVQVKKWYGWKTVYTSFDKTYAEKIYDELFNDEETEGVSKTIREDLI